MPPRIGLSGPLRPACYRLDCAHPSDKGALAVFDCNQCDSPVVLADPETVEVYRGDFDGDEPPLYFCSAGCAGTFMTDMG